MLSTAVAPLSVRRRPTAARLVPTSTGCSHGVEAYRFGRVSRAARCLLACERWLETPGSSPSLPAAAGVRAGPPGSAKLGAGLRARCRRRASMARRSTAACPVSSRRSVQPRQALWEGPQGQSGRIGRDGALRVPCLRALRSGRRQRACAARRSTAGCSPPSLPFQQCLLPRFSRCNRLRGRRRPPRFGQRCLRLRHARRLAARVACRGPAWRAARRERGQQAVQRSLTRSERR